MKEFTQLVKRTHDAGLKMIIDFVPNHVARCYHSDAKPKNVVDLGEKDDTSLFFSPKNNFYYLPGTTLGGEVDWQDYTETPARATGNNRFFLTDHTGNRRFLTFEIESIVPPQTYEYNYEGVYAQAYALWRQGYRYWFNDEENDEINQCNTEFESPNKERELIMKYYRRPLPGEQCLFLTATDMLERINGGIKEQLSTVRIGMVMRELGIERIRSGNLRGYRLIENTQADIEVKQKSMGSFTEQ
jgi:hypothetical protein